METPLVGLKRSGVVLVVGVAAVAGLAGVASALVITALVAEVPATMVVGVVVVEGTPGTSVLSAGFEDAGVVCPWLAVTVVFWMTESLQKMTTFFLLKI